jgi:hypothetical protein
VSLIDTDWFPTLDRSLVPPRSRAPYARRKRLADIAAERSLRLLSRAREAALRGDDTTWTKLSGIANRIQSQAGCLLGRMAENAWQRAVGREHDKAQEAAGRKG